MMKTNRIIKKSVKTSIKDTLFRNQLRLQSESPPPGQPIGTMNYPIIIPDGTAFVLSIRGTELLTDLDELPECCYDAVLGRREVYTAIDTERKYQDDKWGENKPQSLPGFLVVLEQELNEAKLAWAKNITGDHAVLNEVVQIAATAVACLEKYGVTGSAQATNDIPEDHS